MQNDESLSMKNTGSRRATEENIKARTRRINHASLSPKGADSNEEDKMENKKRPQRKIGRTRDDRL